MQSREEVNSLSLVVKPRLLSELLKAIDKYECEIVKLDYTSKGYEVVVSGVNVSLNSIRCHFHNYTGVLR